MTITKVLLVDDERSFTMETIEDRQLGVTTTRTSLMALHLLQLALDAGRVFDEVWLDHDLGGDDSTRPVAEFLVAHPEVVGEFVFVHSMNPPAAERLMGLLKQAPEFRTFRAPDPVGCGLVVDKSLLV